MEMEIAMLMMLMNESHQLTAANMVTQIGTEIVTLTVTAT